MENTILMEFVPLCWHINVTICSAVRMCSADIINVSMCKGKKGKGSPFIGY